MEFVRKKYINILNDHINDQNIKVITGIRRIGKSTILNQFINFLLNDLKIMNTQIQKYDFNNPFLVKKTYPKVYQEILKKAIKNETNYLFFDEIQEIKNFERLIIGLYENKDFDFDIYITGSNSHMFSSELVTLFTGRTFELEIFPFSFIEVCEFLLNNNSHWKTNLEIYLKKGGLGAIVPFYENDVKIFNKLNDIFLCSIKKDIKEHHHVKFEDGLERISKYIYSNIGKSFSATNIENFLRSNKEVIILKKTILNYLKWLEDSFLIKKIAFYDLKGKNILRMKAKYYASDLGLLNHLNKNSNSIEGYKLENLIFLNLLEQGYEVYTAKDYQNNEIDFVCIKNFETVYIQVTTVLNNENFGRETAAFNKIKDGYSKIIICYENNSTFELNGIKLFTFNEWLNK